MHVIVAILSWLLRLFQADPFEAFVSQCSGIAAGIMIANIVDLPYLHQKNLVIHRSPMCGQRRILFVIHSAVIGNSKGPTRGRG